MNPSSPKTTTPARQIYHSRSAGSNSVTVKLSRMSKDGNDTEVPESDKGLADGLRTTRESAKNVGEKTRLLQEQLLRLEKKLWGKKADETVQS